MRVLGSPGCLPGWVGEDPELPRVFSAGPWLSTPGLLPPGLGRQVAETALGAARWTARQFLGLPGLDDGAPADFVVYDRNPVADLHVLEHPAHVVLGGRLVIPSPH